MANIGEGFLNALLSGAGTYQQSLAEQERRKQTTLLDLLGKGYIPNEYLQQPTQREMQPPQGLPESPAVGAMPQGLPPQAPQAPQMPQQGTINIPGMGAVSPIPKAPMTPANFLKYFKPLSGKLDPGETAPPGAIKAPDYMKEMFPEVDYYMYQQPPTIDLGAFF